MPTRTYAGVEVAVDEQGFFLDPTQWDERWPPRSPRPRACPS